MEERTLYCCQRCDHEFSVPGVKATVESCPKCKGVAEPVGGAHPIEGIKYKPAVLRAHCVGDQMRDQFVPKPEPQRPRPLDEWPETVKRIKKVEDDARLAMLKIPYGHVLDLLRWSMSGEFPRVVQRIVGCNIPEDCRVIEVHSDFLSRCFCITLQHSSFAVVPEGEMIPGLPGSPHMTFQSIECPPPGFVAKKCELLEDGTVRMTCDQTIPKFDGGSPPESPVIRFGEPPPPGSQG